ncbi:hypothetical protein ASPFODRAFT_213248 [Aspergillus luchuensis CBS 106.47]|uniref:NmrA-like family domain-containing protein 1 n=1 Tax=Aspergillus luchuensis (strain CBS 106.47) TaxID=1137211 RepID=A0A1M3SYG7_ASPLC|nr:hypothetical protein ASPFODRAFT_213248 [Aspergillus luchuensis CBS 106.47]
MSKLLVVFGATGNQGGSVIRHVLSDPTLSKEFKIRGITRDATKPAAKQLFEKGVEVVIGDMGDGDSLAAAVQGAHTVFLVTNFWETASKTTEVAQGKAVVDACKAAHVQHLIFSSLINTTKASRGRLSHIHHFDGKAEVEEYIRQIGVPATFFLPGTFMSSFKDLIHQQDDGSYLFTLPVGDNARLPLFDAAGDTGLFVKAIIKNRGSLIGERVYGATDYYSPTQMVQEFSKVTGKVANFLTVPAETFKSFLPPPISEEIYENMELLADPGYYAGASLEGSLALLDQPPTSWKAFVEQNAEKPV